VVWQSAHEHVNKYVCGCTTVCDVPGEVRCKIVHAPKAYEIFISLGECFNHPFRESRQTRGVGKSIGLFVLIRVRFPLLLFAYSALGVSGGALFKTLAELTLSFQFASSVDASLVGNIGQWLAIHEVPRRKAPMALGAAFVGPIGCTSPLNTVVLILWDVEVNRVNRDGPTRTRSPVKELVKGVRIALDIHEKRVEMEERRGGKGAGAIVKTGM
jgi:hypothetical protein